MFPWLVVIGVVVWRVLANQRKGVLTVERKAFLRHALHWTDTTKLEKAAKLFDKVSLPDQAKLLRNRIALRKQPRQVLEAREQVLKKALVSRDPNELERYAKLFADQGASNTCDLLKSLALALRIAASVPPVVIPVEPLKQEPPQQASPVDQGQAPVQNPDPVNEQLTMQVTPLQPDQQPPQP